jgi:hypothetical protein
MNRAFEECIRKNKLVPFPRAKRFAKKELTAASEDLAEAKDRFGHEKFNLKR